jgi:hypothetical protein
LLMPVFISRTEMIMKPNVSTILLIALFAAMSAISAGLSRAGADELSNLRGNQAPINSRIDQLAKPAGPQTGDQPTLDNSPRNDNATGGGSFPRSFLIPGTDTSIRIGGFVDGTMGYHSQ